jgi:hypothetical protein
MLAPTSRLLDREPEAEIDEKTLGADKEGSVATELRRLR